MRGHRRSPSVQERSVKLLKPDLSPTQSTGGINPFTCKFGNKSTDSTTALGLGSLKILEKPEEHFSVVTTAQALCAGNTVWFLLSSAFRKAGVLLETNQVS